MTRRTFRHIASIVLLAAYLPMVVLSSLHIHHETIDNVENCADCANHVAHPGHIDTMHHHQSDCQYCLFLSLNYDVQAAEQSMAPYPMLEVVAPMSSSPMLPIHHGVPHSHAPPFVV